MCSWGELGSFTLSLSPSLLSRCVVVDSFRCHVEATLSSRPLPSPRQACSLFDFPSGRSGLVDIVVPCGGSGRRWRR